jgi:hypothetical protein
MASVRFTDVQFRPTEFLDLTSLTLEEFQTLVPPFEAAFHAHMAVWRLDGKPRTTRQFTVEFIPLKVLAAMGGRRTRKVCRAQPRAIVRSLTPCFHKRLQSLTLRQRLTRLWTGSIRSRRWCSAWVANGCSRGLLATNRDKLNRHVRGASYQKESGINSPIVTSCVLQARLSMWAVPLSGPAGNSRPHVARRSGARRRPRRSCEVSQSHWVAP